MQPTLGRIVLYTLTAANADAINRRRTTTQSVTERLTALPQWPVGAQAHLGNAVYSGQAFPMIVVRSEPGEEAVNGQVWLDGTDVLWVTSAREGTGPGTWAWPPRA